MIRVDKHEYAVFCQAVCERFGLSKQQADATVKYQVLADSLGIYTHGTYYLKKYLAKVPAGGMSVESEPEIAAQGSSWAVIEGNNVVPPYVAHVAMELGMEKARKTGVSYVTVRNSGHFGACGAYAVEAARHGFFALVFSNTPPNMAIPGGKGKGCGNSPIAFAAPAIDGKPVFMDFALSATAGTRVSRCRQDGTPIPEGWIVDENGKPTTDYNKPYSLMPMAAHKGYCLSVMVEVMTAVLAGGKIMHEQELWLPPEAVPSTSHCFVLIDVDAVIGLDVFEANMQNLKSQIAATPLAEGSEKIWYPGEKEWANYADNETNGLRLPDDVEKNMRWLAEQAGISFPNIIA